MISALAKAQAQLVGYVTGTSKSIDGFVDLPVLSAREGLEVYRRMGIARQLDVLADLFANVLHVLGGVAFNDVARRYLQLFPSRDPRLEFIGQDFPAFLRADGANSAVVDLASLTWARLESLLAQDGEFAVGELRDSLSWDAIDPDTFARQTCVFHPSLRVVCVETDVESLWLATLTPSATLPAKTDQVQAAVQHLVSYRTRLTNGHFAVVHEAIKPAEAKVFAAGTLEVAAICELLARAETADGQGEPVQAIWTTWSRWFARGWVSQLQTRGHLLEP